MQNPDWNSLRTMPLGNCKHHPLIVGHRGAAGLAPENTLAAFQAAIELDLDGVEFDVQRSADGTLIVMHDEALNRTTNGSGAVREWAWQELQQLDAGSWFHELFRGEKIPSLAEVFDCLRDSDLILHIELKSPTLYPGIEAQVADLIRIWDLVERVQVRSFHHPSLHTMFHYAPEIALSELRYDRLPTPDEFSFKTINALHKLVTSEAIEQLHSAGKKITVWTVNDTDLARRLMAMGVDEITSDYPDRLLSLVRSLP